MVYSDRTRQRQNDGVKDNALDLGHLLVNRSIQTGRAVSKKYTIETPSLDVGASGLNGPQGKSKGRRLLCYAGGKSPSRQLDDFEIIMLISSFIQTRRPVTPASLLLSF